ncbi:FAD-dependent monooxygenase [Amycolatopsis saalfeldensis]|uniref:4,5-epoxidase n=1 Tax=Amycolatopsis saalfeldensis TaxID=394193 RepID=A0A1H8YN24_9PSEU|nr:FAD-dependent monooxygenase [Amycolatopsis saalfeldensis]SEP53559.1 4,5-epoxidase [Amycolatopsis saalfeldensis]
MEPEPEVLIAGAGPTGLTLACGLLASGVTVRVVDRAAEPAGTSRALGLQPRGIEVVERLGALSDLAERSLQVERIVVHLNGEQAASIRVGQRTALVTRPGLVISQAEVEAALRRRVVELGGHVEWGREVVAAEQDPHGVLVTFADGDEKRVAWLVGCDGAHSRVRQLAGIGFPGVPLAERFLLVDVHADLPLARNSIYAWLEGDNVFGAFPLPGPDLWRLMAPTADPGTETDRATQEAVLADITRMAEERTGYHRSLIRSPEWVTSFRIHRRLADTYRDGRILLAGDAAHIHSPFGGQGMNTGIGDAENLAWKLAMVVNGSAEHALLDSYEAERRPIAAKVLKSTGAISNLLLGDHFFARLLRDRVIIPLMNRATMQRLVWENVSQLKVSYQDGPLGHRARKWLSGKGPRPGDRVPDIECVRAEDGGRTGLHAELGNKWALVVSGQEMGDEHTAVTVKHLGEHGTTTLISGQTPKGDTMLVRPDAHLGWRGQASPDVLDRWLSTALRRGRAD